MRLGLAAWLLLAACAVQAAGTLHGKVVGVADGDTVTVLDARKKRHKIRLQGIDAPELRQAFGRQSRRALAALCQRQRARVEVLEQDVSGRSVARVQCQGVNVAQAQVRAGMAWVAPGYVRGDGGLQALERQARQRRVGLWAQPRPTPPWAYRHRRSR